MDQTRVSGSLRLISGVTLLFLAALAHTQTAAAASPTFVAPSEILTGEPFLFTAGGQVSGVVVDIKTVEGEVVASKRTDKQGRVFLAAGLAAGTYLVTSNGAAKPMGKLTVASDTFDPFACANTGLHLAADTPPVDVSGAGILHGNFPHPNSLTLEGLGGQGKARVLAATTSQMAFDKPTEFQIQPGEHRVVVGDSQSHESATAQVVFYSAQARLAQVKIASGAETHLVVNVLPKQLESEVVASILSGPVTFSNGNTSMSQPTVDGVSDFPIQSTPGSTGKFDVAWELKPRKLKWHLWEPKKWKSYLWTPPTQATAPAGDTKAQEDDGWVKFVEGEGKDQRTGKKKIVRSSEGFVQEVKVYDDDKSSVMITTRTGEKRKTITTDTTTTTSEGRTEVVETMEYGKDDKGEWTPKSGTRETKTIIGGSESVKTETWSPKSGWK